MELIQKDSIATAKTYVKKKIDSLVNTQSFDKIPQYIYPLGYILIINNPTTNLSEVLNYHSLILSQSSKSAKYQSYMALSQLYNDQGEAALAYRNASKANQIAKDLNNKELLLESTFYQSEYAMKNGNYKLLFKHTDDALDLIKLNPQKKYDLAPRVYNYKGAISYFSGKSDSANYYFDKALKEIKNIKQTPENQYYLPATIRGNWFLVKQSEGNFEEAMTLCLEGIALFQKFLAHTKNHPLTSRVHGNLSISFRNIGSLYYDLGDKEKALKFAEIGYNHAKRIFLPNTMHYYNAVTMMGEANLYGNNLNEAFKYLNEAKKVLKNIDGDNYIWNAQLNRTFGDAYFKMGDYKNAVTAYEDSKKKYLEHNPDMSSQNQIYLYLGLARAYSKIKAFKKAKQLATEVYDLAQKNYGENAYLSKTAILTLGEISFEENNFESAINYAKKGLNIIENLKTHSEKDLAFFGIDYVDFLLLHDKAKYKKTNKHDVTKLKEIAVSLDNTIGVLERKKMLKSSTSDILNDFSLDGELFEFAKKIQLDLYFKTNNQKYLNNLIELHESSIYQRIRARLNLKELIVKEMPEAILNEEKKLKNNLQNIIEKKEINETNIDSFTNTIAKWDAFLENLKIKQPRYFKMRYASLKNSVDTLLNNVDKKTTLVRYFNVDNSLFVLVVNKEKKHLEVLNNENISELINTTQKFNNEEVLDALHQLYSKLWKPIEKHIHTERVIIYPHGSLFNLSFELLTPQKIDSYSNLSKSSLLATHDFSYNYSLFLLDDRRNTLTFDEDFIAFAPEFNSEMKKNYRFALKDSVDIDKTYLTLLPQPFSLTLVERLNEKFRGKMYVNENASKQIFTKAPKEHKIIHIGTHAESNNLNPELSRLVFAKNVSDSTSLNDNYLYTYEIYNQNLSSELAILTACETGKPAFQPGEGMISLAHAFNYAGSKSILTSLWQIDEKSSTEIISSFYNYLEKGLAKDEALKQSKLDYLKTAKGRTLHPSYWAGLVLMGDANPIELSSSNTFFWFVIISLIILFFIAIMYKTKKPSK